MSSNKQLQATVHGQVQGVSFRYYTRKEAERLRLVGWVANQPDSTVRVVAEGSEETLQQLVAFLHQGSPMALVTKVEVAWQPATGSYSQFSVRWY